MLFDGSLVPGAAHSLGSESHPVGSSLGPSLATIKVSSGSGGLVYRRERGGSPLFLPLRPIDVLPVWAVP